MDPGRHWLHVRPVGTVIAILAVIAIVYLLVRKNKYDEEHLGSVSAVRASGN